MSTRNSRFLNFSKRFTFFKKIYFFYNIYVRNYKFLFSNSQFNESQIINNLFSKNYVGNFIDVGCFHPTKYNNTYVLYKRGWSGINIDLNPLSIDFFNFLRPRDTNICAAISNNKKKKQIFFLSDLSSENTIEPSHKIFLKKHHNYKNNEIKIKYIKTIKLEEILKKYKYYRIDLFNIDIEGHELKVLKSINFKKFDIRYICVEMLNYNSHSIKKNKILINFLKKNGYILKAKTKINYFFKKK